jgi:xanthine/uracil/vitamin C permease (AzgA family)
MCVSAGGAERFEYFNNVVAVPDARKTTLAWSFSAFHRSELWVALITFLYLDFLDATGTLFSMGKSCGYWLITGLVRCQHLFGTMQCSVALWV